MDFYAKKKKKKRMLYFMGKFNKTRQEFKEIIWHYFRQPREKGPNEDGRRSASLRFEL